jgi:hypothetical protein
MDQVNRELGPDRDLVFWFGTGLEQTNVRCGANPTPDEPGGYTATAIAAGWLARACEDNRSQLQLTDARGDT